MLTLSIAVTGPKRDFNISPKDALEAAARGISNIVTRRLRDRNRRTAPNRYGLPKSNYYAREAIRARSLRAPREDCKTEYTEVATGAKR